jgi:hypothetical protein
MLVTVVFKENGNFCCGKLCYFSKLVDIEGRLFAGICSEMLEVTCTLSFRRTRQCYLRPFSISC